MLSTKSSPPKWSPYLCLWVLMMGCICATGDICYDASQHRLHGASQWSVSECQDGYECKYNGTENAQCLWTYGPSQLSQNFTTSTPQMNPHSCYKMVLSKTVGAFDCLSVFRPHCCFSGTSDAQCCQYEPGPNHETCYDTTRKYTCPDNHRLDSYTNCCNNNTEMAQCCDPTPQPTIDPDLDIDVSDDTVTIIAVVGSVCAFAFIIGTVRSYIRYRRENSPNRTAVVFPQQPAVVTAQTGNPAQTANAVPPQQPGLYPPPNNVYPNQLPPTHSGQAYPYPSPSPGSVYTIPVPNQAPPAYAIQDPAGSQAGIGFENVTQDPKSQTSIGFDNRSFLPTCPQDPSVTPTPQKR